MTDRLTQLQEEINCQAENLCNAIGILQQSAPPSPFLEFEKPQEKDDVKQQQQQPQNPQQQQQQQLQQQQLQQQQQQTKPVSEDYPQLFAQCIVRTAKNIDVLIDSLPNDDILTPELQAASLRRLESDNEKAAKELEEAVKRCEEMLKLVKGILKNIAQKQLYENNQKNTQVE